MLSVVVVVTKCLIMLVVFGCSSSLDPHPIKKRSMSLLASSRYIACCCGSSIQVCILFEQIHVAESNSV